MLQEGEVEFLAADINNGAVISYNICILFFILFYYYMLFLYTHLLLIMGNGIH